MSNVLVGDTGRKYRRAPVDSEPTLAWIAVAWAGLALAIVGWTDLALLWYPTQFGHPEWEFGTIGAHFNGMPLGTVGLTLLAAGAIGRGRRRTARFLAIIILLVVTSLLVMSVIYWLDAPLILRATAAPLKADIKTAMLKTGIYAATYALFYAWLAWFLWRKTSRVKT